MGESCWASSGVKFSLASGAARWISMHSAGAGRFRCIGGPGTGGPEALWMVLVAKPPAERCVTGPMELCITIVTLRPTFWDLLPGPGEEPR